MSTKRESSNCFKGTFWFGRGEKESEEVKTLTNVREKGKSERETSKNSQTQRSVRIKAVTIFHFIKYRVS